MRMMRFAVVGVSMACLQGCLSPDPATLVVTERDKAVYVDQGAAKQVKEEKARVAILVSAEDKAKNGSIAQSLDSQLTAVLSPFAFFQMVERSNLGALNQEAVLASLSSDGDANVDIPQADFLITAKLSAVDSEVRFGDHLSFKSDVTVDFRFYELASKKLILARNIPKSFSYNQPGDRVARSADVVKECAKAFGLELGMKYAPPARVLEVRGNGQVARISMGTNYGVVKGGKIDFFEYSDASDVIAGASREPSVVARGTVLESDDKSAWVEVGDFEKVQVKRGHYVRIRSDQSKGLRDAFRVDL